MKTIVGKCLLIALLVGCGTPQPARRPKEIIHINIQQDGSGTRIEETAPKGMWQTIPEDFWVTDAEKKWEGEFPAKITTCQIGTKLAVCISTKRPFGLKTQIANSTGNVVWPEVGFDGSARMKVQAWNTPGVGSFSVAGIQAILLDGEYTAQLLRDGQVEKTWAFEIVR